MANEIKQKIVLEGEKEYKSALQDAQRHLKTLRSELKAETAELGKNATEQQKNEVRVKNLQKQIAEQEKIVKTYTAALDEVREKYADNEDEIAKWEVKLNDARTALANMKNGLEDVDQGFRQTTADANTGVTAAKSFADAFGGLASIGEGISGAIEDIFTGMIDSVKMAVGELWQLVTETAAKANNWTDLGNYFGSSAEQMQLMDRAISETAGDFGKFTNLISQLSFGNKNDKIAEWFGISDENYKNNVDYTMAVLDAMQQAYKEWGTGGKWDDAMTEIFGGKKSADVSWFVTNLDTIKAKMKELQENGGYLINEEELSTMNDVHVQLNTVEDRWDALKSKFAAGFGQVTLDIMTNIQGGLDALAKYFDADTPEEREAALAELEKSIMATFETIAQAIRDGIAVLEKVAEDLKASKDPIVQGIGNILGGIVDALKWFTEDNAQNVVKALEIIAAFWITGKGLTMATKIAEVVANLKTIQLFNALNGAGTAGAGANAGASAGASAGVTGGWLGLDGWGGLAGLGLIGASWAWAVDRRLNHKEDVLGTDENLMASAGGNTEFMQKFAEWILANAKSENLEMDVYEGKATEAEYEELQKRIGELYEQIEQDKEFSKTWDSYNAWREENGMSMTQWELPADWWKGGTNEDGVTSQDIQSLNRLPEATKAAVAGLIGSIQINLDGNKVADLLTPRVSANIARDMD